MTKKEFKIIDMKKTKRYPTFKWFSSFSNPTYGFNVKIDVTNVLNKSHETNTSFFVNFLYLTMLALNSTEALKLRIVRGHVRLYSYCNPAFTVMTKNGDFDNAQFKNEVDYKLFYIKAKEVIETIKNEDKLKEGYNDSLDYDEYYITCVPWLAFESMTHPIPDDIESASVPRICWSKYYQKDNKIYLNYNLTVSHALVDGKDCSDFFNTLNELIKNIDLYIKQ